MVTWLAYPKPLAEADESAILTFIVPAPDGCNLKCPYCIIAQRSERDPGKVKLVPSDYAAFIDGIALNNEVGVVAIQGDEPLLPESLPYTYAILEAARRHGIPSSLVTNGTYLEGQISRLVISGVAAIAVSLDGASAGVHDKLRGVPGTFAAAVRGLERAATIPELYGRVFVSSVLLPRRTEYLSGMPTLLDSIGVEQWHVNPLLRIGADGNEFQFSFGSESELITSLRVLENEARHAGIDFVIDDDFDKLWNLRRSTPALRNMRFKTLSRDAGVLRLLPSGACDVGHQILYKHRGDGLVWCPGEEASSHFYQRALDELAREGRRARQRT